MDSYAPALTPSLDRRPWGYLVPLMFLWTFSGPVLSAVWDQTTTAGPPALRFGTKPQ